MGNHDGQNTGGGGGHGGESVNYQRWDFFLDWYLFLQLTKTKDLVYNRVFSDDITAAVLVFQNNEISLLWETSYFLMHKLPIVWECQYEH